MENACPVPFGPTATVLSRRLGAGPFRVSMPDAGADGNGKGHEPAACDGVELEVIEGSPAHYASVARALDDNGLESTAVTVIPDEARNPLSPDPACRRAARLPA